MCTEWAGGRAGSPRLFGLTAFKESAAAPTWRKPSEVLRKRNDGLLLRMSTLSLLWLGGPFTSYCSLVALGRFVEKPKNISLSAVSLNCILLLFSSWFPNEGTLFELARVSHLLDFGIQLSR